MADNKRSWLDKFTDLGGDISDQAFRDTVDHPSAKAVNDKWNEAADKKYGEGSGASRLGDAERAAGESPTSTDDDVASAEKKSPDSYYDQLKEKNAESSGKLGLNKKRKIGAALGGGGLVGGLIGIAFMLLPLKIPAIMSMIAGEAGQRVEQVAQHRATMIMARAIAQKFATSGSGYVIEGGLFQTLVASMRTNNFEKRLAEKGLVIEKSDNGVKLTMLGGEVGDGVLKNEVQIKKALEANKLTNKMIKDIVREDIPTWRWMKRAKFAKWLRHKYGIPRYGITNSQESDSDAGIAETESNRLEAEAEGINSNATEFADCVMDSDGACSLVGDGDEKRPDTMSSADGSKEGLTSPTADAVADTLNDNPNASSKELSSIFEKALLKKFGTAAAVNAIPVAGQIISAVDTASIVNHMLKEQAETDYIGKAVAGLKEANYAQLYGNWAGYGSQIQLGAMRPDYIGKLAEQTEGIEKAQAFNYIEGNTVSGNPITLLGGTAYATTGSDIPGVPVDRIDSNNPGSISKKMEDSGITKAINFYNKTPAGFTLEVWYNTIGQGGAAGWATDKLAGLFGFLSGLVPADLTNWVNDLISSIWLKLLKLFGLDFNPFVSGPQWFNNAHGGATASFNTYGREVGLRKLSATQATLQNQSIAAERAEYIKQKGTMYALFSSEVPSSLTNQLAIAAPNSAAEVGTTTASLIGRIPSLITSAVMPQAKAANPYVDLYGVDPYGATDADLNAPLTEEFVEGEECPEVAEGSFNTCSVDKEVGSAMFCSFEPESEDCNPEEATETELTTSGGTAFRIASYNIKIGSSDAWQKTSTGNMSENKFDVVGMQEAESWDTYSGITKKLKALGYAVYPDITQQEVARNGAQARVIAYNTSKFTLVKTDEVTFNRMDDPVQPARAPIVWLQDNTTGQQVIVINTHNPAYGYTGGPNSNYNGPKQRHEAALKYLEKITQLQAEGLPIFFTGDFNEGWGVRPKLNTTLDGDYHNLFYCMLKENADIMVHAQDVASGSNPACSQNRPYGPVDHIYVSQGVLVHKYARLTGGPATLGTDHESVPYADVEVPGSGSGATAGVRVATFNVLHAPDNNWRDRLKKSVKALTDKQISIAGLQEMRPEQQKLFKQADYGGGVYDMYPASVTNGRPADENPDSVVVWDKAKFELVSGKQKSIKYEGGDRKVNIVKLRYIEGGASGPELYVLNTHDPIDDRSEGASGAQNRKDNNELYYDTIKNELSDAPVIFTGDFNSKMTVAASKNKPLNGSRDNLVYCIMTNNDLLTHVSDAQQGKTGSCPSQKDVLGRNDVDHIFISPSLKASNYGVVARGPNKNGGDHDMVYSDITIPGIASSETGSWSWPVDKTFWNRNHSDFTGPHFAGSGTWTNGIDSLAADIGSPEKGSTVYAMFGGKVSNADLGGHGLAISTDIQGGVLEIAYAHGPRANANTSYNAGDPIMSVGCLGNCDGAHLHVDMSFNGKGVCPQDVFIAFGNNQVPDFASLTRKAVAPCGR